MAEWTGGYVSEIGYTFGYYKELNPVGMKLALAGRGLCVPEVRTACELGFGQGMSANIHAAASSVDWYGTDFNPSQAAFAQELAVASGAQAHFFDEAFAEFANRQDLPNFDFIGLHGIWSWISDANRRVIVDFIHRKLNVGGVLYISYNTLPGWSSFAPMRHLMTQHADVLGSEGRGIVNRINGALDFTEQLLATQPLFGRAHPLVNERLKQMKGQNRHYLAHEYFNRDWQPMYYADMAGWLQAAKLQYAGSAHYLDHVDALNIAADQQKLLNEVPAGNFRETVRDFIVNQQFRRDYWVKGARTMSPLDQTDALRAIKIVLTSPRADITLKVTGALGEGTMEEAVYLPILDLLGDHKPRSIAQIEQAMQGRGVSLPQIGQAVMILAGAGHLALAQDDVQISKAKKQTDKLNACLRGKARGNSDMTYLASPVTGGGLTVNRIQQMFLTSLSQGRKQPSEWAQAVWPILAAQGQRMLKDGATLETAEGNIAELTTQAQKFADKDLPVLRALQVA